MPAPETFDIRRYTKGIFNMYEGEREEVVTMRCQPHIMDHIIDYFGRDVETAVEPDGSFIARVRVSLSATFYAWLFRYPAR